MERMSYEIEENQLDNGTPIIIYNLYSRNREIMESIQATKHIIENDSFNNLFQDKNDEEVIEESKIQNEEEQIQFKKRDNNDQNQNQNINNKKSLFFKGHTNKRKENVELDDDRKVNTILIFH